MTKTSFANVRIGQMPVLRARVTETGRSVTVALFQPGKLELVDRLRLIKPANAHLVCPLGRTEKGVNRIARRLFDRRPRLLAAVCCVPIIPIPAPAPEGVELAIW